MSTWRRHRAQRNSRASSIAPPGGEGWTIRDHRAILHSEPYASADLGAASDVTAKSVQSEAASASSPTPISLQLTSDVIAGTPGARVLWQAASAQGGNNDTSQADAVGRFSAGSLRPAQSVHEGCSPFIRAFSQPPTLMITAAANLFFDVMARISHVDFWDDFYGDPESRWARQWFVFKYYSEPFVTLGIVGVGAGAFYLWVTGQFALVAVWYSKFIEWIFV